MIFYIPSTYFVHSFTVDVVFTLSYSVASSTQSSLSLSTYNCMKGVSRWKMFFNRGVIMYCDLILLFSKKLRNMKQNVIFPTFVLMVMRLNRLNTFGTHGIQSPWNLSYQHWDSNYKFTYWGRDGIAPISQTTFSNTFYWMKYIDFKANFTDVCSQEPNEQHWFR